MAYREFQDGSGRGWRVWDVLPERMDRRSSQDRRAGERGGPGRRRPLDAAFLVAPSLAAGWLCFESEGDRRRLSPVPEGWSEVSAERLEEWLAAAAVATASRVNG